MASKYWIKLYHEIIDDPKMARLSDRLFRRTMQLFLLAGEMNGDGHLPSTEDIAWRIRCDLEELESEMIELQDLKIISKVDGQWLVTKFAERQAPVPGKERVARFRDRKRKETYYGTIEIQDGNDNETIRYTDTDTDTESDAEEKLNGVTADAEPPEPVAKAPKKKKKERDPLLDNPAIIAYRDEVRLHVPIPWREEVCKIVDDPERWKELVHEWIGHGWNKQNISGMLEAYRNGGIGEKREEPAGFEAIRSYRQKAGLDNG